MLPGKSALQGVTGALWVQVRMECSTKQENGLGKAALTLCPWGGPWSLEQDLALEGPGFEPEKTIICLLSRGPLLQHFLPRSL